jgi:Flp pilus assembly protein TadG
MRTGRQPKRHGPARSQRGVAMVEFVVGTPLLLLLFYAICEFGNLFVQYSALTDAARDADRYLASNALLGSTGVVNLSPGLVTATQNLVVFGNTAGAGTPLLPGLTTGQVTVAVDASNNVSVHVAYPYQSLFGGLVPFFVNRGALDTAALTLNAYSTTVAL